MNKGLKKLLTSALAAALLTSSVGAMANTLPEDIQGTRFEDSVQVLAALGIMVGDRESGLIRPDDEIRRSEVAKMAVTALGLEDVAESSTQSTKFPDVVEGHWATGYINVANSQNIVIGDPDGNFRPDDSITYAEAMAIMVRILGYDPVANTKGGFPSGYIVVGSDKGLNKNVKGSTNDPILRGDVANMTYNSLTVKLMEQVGFGNDMSFEEVDKTLLLDKLGVTKGEGQISAIESSSLTGSSSLRKGQVKIGDDIFETSYNINNLFGYNVVYYSVENDDGENEIILATPKKDANSSVVITADLFESITEKSGNKAVSYYKSESTSKTSTAELDEDAILIYNGKCEEMSDELINIKDKAGNITLLDTNKDGKYDIVFVTEYENMVVEEVTSTHKIVDKYGKPSLKLDPEDTSVSYRITMGLEELETDDLEEYDVLSVAASLDKELYDVIVTRKSVSGKITEKDDEGVTIGGEHYKVAANYTQALEMGTEGVFYLDAEGKIAAVDTAATLSSNYAYLIRAYTDSNTENTSFKVYTSEGKEVNLEANEKIKFNGKSGTLSKDAAEALKEDNATVKQLVTYDLNSDGKVIALNTAKDNTATGNVDENHFTKNYVLENAEYNQKTGKIGNINITEDTIIFDIPADASSSSDYSIADISMFEDEAKYDITVFDRQDDYSAKAIIISNASFRTNAEAPIAVVNKISGTSNDDDVETDKLYAFVDGKETEIIAEEKGILVKGEDKKPLVNGDIIQYKTNEKGEIINIRVLFDVSAKDTETEYSPAENLDIVYGKVTQKFAQSMNVSVNDGEVKNYALTNDVTVYILDTAKSKNNIEVATTGDIQKFNEDEGNRVFIKIYKDVVTEVVIVK
ncbi:MAG: S-layer homology domain-containing protein [Oscillospiraceae bacterium]|nr:S-layer homology domain-containing protein [Oscillospiraceae bacterium]